MIDPRTGEKLTQWSKLDSTLFCELVTNFLSDHELPVECNNDESNGKKVSPKLPNIKYLYEGIQGIIRPVMFHLGISCEVSVSIHTFFSISNNHILLY